jgi:hypothetical protein
MKHNPKKMLEKKINYLIKDLGMKKKGYSIT